MLDLSNLTSSELAAALEAEQKRILKNIQYPKLSTPIDLPEETQKQLESYEPQADSLKLKKHLLALQQQTLSINHHNRAMLKLVELCDSHKPEVARRACMTILKLSHLNDAPDLYPYDPDLSSSPTTTTKNPKKKPRKKKPGGYRRRPVNASPPATPLNIENVDMPFFDFQQFHLTTSPLQEIENQKSKIENPSPPHPFHLATPFITIQALHTLLIFILILILIPTRSRTIQPSLTRTSEFITHNSELPPELSPATSPIAIPTNAVILPAMTTTNHTWHFFRAGGFDQVRIDSGADIANLPSLDKKLWVALACPTRGLEFDHKTLDLIDTDQDARIRAPELLAATTWTCSLLKNPDHLTKSSPTLPLAAINDATPEGQQPRASAKQTLNNLAKAGGGDASEISPDDTADTVKIFAQTKFNGDGIIPPDSADNPKLQSIITDIITCFGAETDRSGKPGITQPKLDLFFTDANAFATWQSQPITDPAKSPLGPNTHAAAQTLKAIAAKIEDFFARCRLSAFDPRAAAIISRDTADYATLAPKDLSSSGGALSEIAAFPLARITPNAALPLNDDNAINPAWRDSLDALRAQVLQPLLGGGGAKDLLTEDDWDLLLSKFAPFDAWLAAKAGHTVEKLGLDRIRAILGNNEGSENKTAIAALIARDLALAPEAAAIHDVDKLVHFHRDLYRLLNNFVSFRDFYQQHADHQSGPATFQIWHPTSTSTSAPATSSSASKTPPATPSWHTSPAPISPTATAPAKIRPAREGAAMETMTIAAAFTGGDSDNLMVGRNGVFWDRQGRDWDATITKIVDNPISIRQAFFSPYKRLIRWISEQMAKRAADADAAASARMQAATGTVIDQTTGKVIPAPAPPAKAKLDPGILAALSLAAGFIIGAVTTVLQTFFGLGAWMPLGLLAVIFLISLPSMLIAWFKLRQRNLGPILDANGWAVNAKAKLNIPFGRSLTATPKLPPTPTTTSPTPTPINTPPAISPLPY